MVLPLLTSYILQTQNTVGLLDNEALDSEAKWNSYGYGQINTTYGQMNATEPLLMCKKKNKTVNISFSFFFFFVTR